MTKFNNQNCVSSGPPDAPQSDDSCFSVLISSLVILLVLFTAATIYFIVYTYLWLKQVHQYMADDTLYNEGVKIQRQLMRN